MAKKTANKKSVEQLETVKPGTSIKVVHAGGTHMDAKVTKVNEDDTVDLKLDDGVIITSSPNDPDGIIPDSWHLPGKVIEATEAPKA